ncbi:MAG: hypothetical protein JW876_00040 [Candidatus Krumholzibacteriota bacterium]|nr:hypothetical protein [Candidatus Krumholzibacteriota bacterium]
MTRGNGRWIIPGTPRTGAGRGLVACPRAAACLFFCLLLCFGHAAPATAGEASQGGSFVPMGWDAFGEGLGGAASILVRDDRAAHWNPANLVFLEGARATFGSTKPVPGMNAWYSILSVGTGLLDTREAPDSTGPSMRRLAVALSVSHLGLELAGGSGWNEGSIGFSAAYSTGTNTALGLTLRGLGAWSDLDDADASGIAVDAGFTMRLTGQVFLAVVGRNLASSVSWSDRTDEIEPDIVFAGSYERIAGLVSAGCDLVLRDGEMHRVLFGATAEIAGGLLFVSGGADVRLTDGERTIPTLGAGSRWMGAEVALAFSFDPEDAFGRRTRVSAGFAF